MTKEYSTEGPVCPHCKVQFTADDPSYFDDNLTQLECFDCDKLFAVEVYHETSWTTRPLAEITHDNR